MELKITDPTAHKFTDAVGISEARLLELGAAMDAMSKRLLGKMVYTVDIFKEIAGFCNTTEELVFCTISHCNYMMQIHGIFYCPPKPVKKFNANDN